MLYSNLFGKTVKNIPADAKTVSYQLLYKAGFIRESSSGRYFILPLGQRVQNNIMRIIKEEMDKAGGQEMLSPILHPLSLWQETNRTKSTGYELMIVKDRHNAEFALGGTAEEMFVDVVRKFQLSYRDLPFIIYQFSNKFRDELRARGGLLRVREFIMKDAYSFDRNESEFAKTYERLKKTYATIFQLLGLETHIVESDNGYIGGDYCHEFIVDSQIGESDYFITEDGTYAAHIDVALCDKKPMNTDDSFKELKEIDAKRGKTVQDGADFHTLPLWQQLKNVVYVDDQGRYILTLIRGDYDINENKLKHAVKALALHTASDDEIRNFLNSEPGFLSPVGIKERRKNGVNVVIVADDSLRHIHNMYGGANVKYRDLLNINIDRDYQPDIVTDIMLVKNSDTYKNKRLMKKRGIEVGNIFQLGYYYSDKMNGSVFINEQGKTQKYYMGCYGIGIGRTMAAIVEKHHDKNGIIWPKNIAPFQVHLLNFSKDPKHAEIVYEKLKENGTDVLFDDRTDTSPGEKMNDADLIGIPIRLIVSERTRDKIEYKPRNEKESKLFTIEEIVKLL